MFEGHRDGKVFIRQKQVSGIAGDEALVVAAASPFPAAAPSSWSPDGRFIAFTQGAGSGAGVWILPLAGDRQPFPLANTEFWETSGMFSPDGRWIAYTSKRRRGERRLRAAVSPDGTRHKVSKDGGSHPCVAGGRP